jgi:hypothetical protein
MIRFVIYIIATFILQFSIVFITGKFIEDGDINAASMYPVVYFFPSIMISFCLGFILLILNKLKNNIVFYISCISVFVGLTTLNELIFLKGLEIYRVVMISGFIFNLIIIGYKRKTATNTAYAP